MTVGRSPYERNAAAIRQEGRNLTVQRVRLKNSGNGILYTATDPANRRVKAKAGKRGTLSVTEIEARTGSWRHAVPTSACRKHSQPTERPGWAPRSPI